MAATLDEKDMSSSDTKRDMKITSDNDASSTASASHPEKSDLSMAEPAQNDDNAPESKPDTAAAAALAKSTTTESKRAYTAFSPGEKWFIVIMTSLASFFSPLSGQIYFPVLPILTRTYNLSQSLINISITTYLIFQGLAPSFMGTFSDGSGRRPGYIIAFTIYTAANIGLALQDSYAALLVLRSVQSAGSSGTIAFGYGVLADVVTSAERGKYFGPMAAAVLTAPALGPTIGGLLTQFLGWRSVFWFLTIISGGFLVIYIVVMPETHRKIVDDGSIIPHQWWRKSVVQYLSARRRLRRMTPEERDQYEQTQQELMRKQQGAKIRFPNPLGSFAILAYPDALCLIMFSGIMMFCNQVLMTSTPTVFPRLYNLNELEVGLCFLPLGVTASIGSFMNGRLLDWNYKRTATRLGMTVDRKRGDDLRNFPIERARLQAVFFAQALQVAALLPYGWALDKHASLAVPLVLQGILGFCLVVASNSISTLMSDIFPGQVSTAAAAQNLIRCSLGAVGAAVISDMLNSLGLGWSFVFIGLLMAASTLFLFAELRWGMGWRQKRWEAQARKKEEEKQKELQREAMKDAEA